MDTPGLNPQAACPNIFGEKAVLSATAPDDLNAYPGGIDSLSSPVRAVAPNVITVALAVSDTKARQHIESMLNEADLDIRAKTSVDLVSAFELGDDQTKILEWLHEYFVQTDSRPLILISDLLKPPSEPIGGLLTRECQARFARRALGTMGILPSRQRVTDIDRVIEPDVTREDLTGALVLLIGRLQYLSAPIARSEFDPDSIILRPLRGDNEREFRDYFRLRHRVYSQMGYLDEATEASPSRLEMNEADTHSVHLGAFCRSR